MDPARTEEAEHTARTGEAEYTALANLQGTTVRTDTEEAGGAVSDTEEARGAVSDTGGDIDDSKPR